MTMLSELLQIKFDLTLEKAKKFVRQREAIQQQQSILNDECRQTAS